MTIYNGGVPLLLHVAAWLAYTKAFFLSTMSIVRLPTSSTGVLHQCPICSTLCALTAKGAQLPTADPHLRYSVSRIATSNTPAAANDTLPRRAATFQTFARDGAACMADLPAGSNVKSDGPLLIGQLDRSVTVSPVGTRLMQRRSGLCVLFKHLGP